jgi:hypothetical protein
MLKSLRDAILKWTSGFGTKEIDKNDDGRIEEPSVQKKTGILIVMAGVLLLLLIFTINPMSIFSDDQFGFFSGTKKVNEEKTLAAYDVRELILQTEDSDIKVTKGDGDEIKVRLNGKVSSKNADQVKLKVEPNGDTLVIGVDVTDGIASVWRPNDGYRSIGGVTGKAMGSGHN